MAKALSYWTWRRLAGEANSMASVASGLGEYGLANSLWAFEKQLEDRAGQALVQRRDEILAKPQDDEGWSLYTMEEIHLLRSRQLIDREQYLTLARDWAGEEMGT